MLAHVWGGSGRRNEIDRGSKCVETFYSHIRFFTKENVVKGKKLELTNKIKDKENLFANMGYYNNVMFS